MEITTAMIKELREKTGAGILDCKSALAEANGSIEEAEKSLRKKGLAAAAKKAGRVAAEGLVGYALEGGAAALVELNCETDFVAKTDDFKAARTALAAFVLAEASFGDVAEGNVEALKAMPCPAAVPGAAGTISEWLQAATAKTGENTQLRRFARVVAGEGNALHLYAHPGDKTVVVVETTGCDAELGRDLAMQVAALTPSWAVREQVPEKVLADEREIARAQAVASGKPENVVEKMVEGRIGKFFGESVLVDQPFVKDDSKKVAQVVAERGGKDAKVVRFVRYKVGEGVEKKQSDLAAEVAELAK
ncbi:MAG: translation elongation factor Ts [Thermoanaerobaculia bacterium]